VAAWCMIDYDNGRTCGVCKYVQVISQFKKRVQMLCTFCYLRSLIRPYPNTTRGTRDLSSLS
jgi:hypothetical protein